MAVGNSKQSMRPRIVEVKPSNVAPLSPPPSPKAVRFGSVSRQVSPTEWWSFYHFEKHSRECPACYNPLELYLTGRPLCPHGHDLAQDVAIHVYHRDGEIFSTDKDRYKAVRVELPQGYDQVRSLLEGMDHRLRSASLGPLSYDRYYPVSPRRSLSPRSREYYERRREVVIEPADSRRERVSSRKSKSKPSPSKPVAVHHEPEPEPEPVPVPESHPEPTTGEEKPRERRGSLYVADRQRKEKNYHVEEREPNWARSRKGERRKSAVWV